MLNYILGLPTAKLLLFYEKAFSNRTIRFSNHTNLLCTLFSVPKHTMPWYYIHVYNTKESHAGISA